ncbi:MAG: purine and other phosphorylase-like protein, family 1, partial [Steroidobacteraceae bacterium]
LIAAGCRALASWGLAGALDPQLPCGAVLLPEEVILESGASLATGLAWRRQIEDALQARWLICRRRLLTSARALATIPDKQQAFRRTGAAAVDMESFAVAEEAAARGLPFVVMRVIVDTAADALPPALADAPDGTGNVPVGRIIARALAAPSGLGDLLRLARRYRVASRRLRAVARAGALTAYHP